MEPIEVKLTKQMPKSDPKPIGNFKKYIVSNHIGGNFFVWFSSATQGLLGGYSFPLDDIGSEKIIEHEATFIHFELAPNSNEVIFNLTFS